MSEVVTIASIVEGFGEVQALPVLIRRIAGEIFGAYGVVAPQPHRVKRQQMPSGDVLSRATRVQSARVTGRGGLLIVADADDDCAVHLAALLKEKAKPVEVAVTVAVPEFEAWFLAAVESLRSHRAVRDDASYARMPEAKRDAKGALSAQMVEQYRETLHQVAFAALIDLQLARRARSFEHLVGCIGRLVT